MGAPSLSRILRQGGVFDIVDNLRMPGAPFPADVPGGWTLFTLEFLREP